MKLQHVEYNQKTFLAPDSINSMAAIHCKIKNDGIAKVTISDCNNSMRIWNDFNTNQGKDEMIQKLDTLIEKLWAFRYEVQSRNHNKIYPCVKESD